MIVVEIVCSYILKKSLRYTYMSVCEVVKTTSSRRFKKYKFWQKYHNMTDPSQKLKNTKHM